MPPKLSVSEVKKGFAGANGGLAVLDGVSFDVAEGELVAIVGPSGCGKSTLMNLLAGFERPDSGRIEVDGAPLGRPSPRGILISQRGSVFPWLRVRDNLTFGLANDHGDAARHYAELVGLSGFLDAHPHELSGGMLKRVELARALAVKPDLLFMDEPFSALDALTSLRMRAELLRILAKERHTVVLITHDVEEAVHLADRVLVLSPRPARVQAVFEVPWAQPRKVTSPELQDLRLAVLRELGVER